MAAARETIEIKNHFSLLRWSTVVGAALLLAAVPGCATEGDEDDSSDGVDTDSAEESALTTTTTFQDGVSPSAAYAGTQDVTLEESRPTTNLGNATSLRVDRDEPSGTRQSVVTALRFDLASIPRGSVVSGVELTVNVTNPTSRAGYLLFPLARAWSESQATWRTATSGGAWGTAGARATSDRAATSVATLIPTVNGKYKVALNASGVAAVQAWVNDPSKNFGFVLDAVDNMDGLAFDSSEAAVAQNRPALTVAFEAPQGTGSGTGLRGEYFTGTQFATPALTRTDATLNFEWGSGSPGTGVPVDQFSVRWTGQVEALYTETYTFTTRSDDGVRVWVNGRLLIDNFTDHAATENSGQISLTAGTKNDIKVEYYERTGQAVAQLFWSSARQARQIVPKSQLYPPGSTTPPPPPPPPPPVTDLDETGARIPDTNYPIPANAIYMATNGSDTNNGSLGAPVKTINRALAILPANGTIVVRGGVYRDGLRSSDGQTYGIANRTLTIQAYPREQVWFDGTDVIPSANLRSDGAGHWSMPWSTPSFCENKYYNYKYDAQAANNSGPCTHKDMYGDPSNPAAGDPQMVFVDGVPQREVTTLAQATAGSFFYDWANKSIHLGTNPAGRTVEFASRPTFLVMGGTATLDVKILGLGFRRYATNEYSNQTGGAVVIYGQRTLVENCVFKEMAGQALYVGARGGVVRHSALVKNGFNGLGSNGSSKSGTTPDGLLFEKNVISGNNTERFGTNCNLSCAQAGVKLGHMNGFTARDNVVEHNYGWGIWCDLGCSNGVIVRNLVHDNDRGGILYEVSDTGIIASNLVYKNTNGVGIRVCAANTKIYNNTVVDNGGYGNVWIYDDPRTIERSGVGEVGPDTVNVSFANNVVAGTNTIFNAQGTDTTSTNTTPDQFFTVLNDNAYHRRGGANQVLAKWVTPSGVTSYTSLATYRAARPWESRTTDTTAAADPFFVDAAAGNFTIRAGSAAYRSAVALPGDVMQALGLTVATGYDKGAIRWPGN